MNLTEKIKEYAHKLGFDLVGIVPAIESRTIDFYEDWLAKGFGGEMGYLQRHLEKKRDPRSLLDGARSIICLGINYFAFDIPGVRKNDPSRGIISRYAWGLDYHDVIRQKLEKLRRFINLAYSTEIGAKICVDTAPILEREFANRAGIGWIGKNCNLINRKYGSWLFLAELILTKELVYDQVKVKDLSSNEVKDRCGTCTRCIDACPTGALIAPRTLDSRKCISYLTIEHKGIIPRELRSAIGNRIFGCDVCQEVCPWNRCAIRSVATSATERGFFPHKMRTTPKLLELMRLTDDEFYHLFKNSSIKRAKRRGLLRNVAIAIGNWGNQSAVPVLIKALNDPDPLVRHHVAWALSRCGNQKAKDTLLHALKREKEPEVIEEICYALANSL